MSANWFSVSKATLIDILTKLTAVFDTKADASHSHVKNDITDFPTLGTAAAKDVPSSGNATSSQVVMGNDSRLSDSRTPKSHTHTKNDITDFAHTHPLSIATDTGTSAITLAHGGKYKLTAGGSTLVFTMPSDNDHYSWSDITGKPSSYPPSAHTHTKSDITDFPSTMPPSSHTHGNIQNGGTLQTNDVTIANGDKLVITDSSDSSKIARASIAFDGLTATKCLTQKGTWENFTNNAGTITGIKMNGSSKGTSGVVDLGTVITSHQDISGKADKSATVSTVAWDSTNKKLTKTINGTTTDVVTGATILSGLTKIQVTTALGYTPPTSDTNTTYTLAAGTGGDANKLIFTPSSGSATKVTVPYATSAGSAPASDVYAWAKASTKPTYTANEVGALASTTKYAGSSSVGGAANSAIKVDGVYTGSGGKQGPGYYGKNYAGFLMSNENVSGDTHYKNWLYMDCYSGTDVGGATAIGVDRQEPRMFIMQSDANRTSWNNTAAVGVFTATPTSGQVVITDGTTGGVKSSGFTIATSVPANAVFTDHYAWSDITSKPTTLSGYGITDAKIANGTITLGSNSITPLTSFTETDPTVPSWAKAASKPSYNFGEIGAGVAIIGDGNNRLMFRTHASYKAGMYYSTPGNEALVFANYNAVTSWIFANVDPTSGTAWTSLTPGLQIKGSCVAINKLIDNNVTPTYNLDVNGSINGTSVKVNGTDVLTALPSHTHGNIQNGGTLQTTDITIASGDKLVVTDSSDSSKIARASISFDGSTATKCLTQKGTWESFLSSHQSVTNKDATLAWSTKSTIATIGSTNITVSLPANPNTDTKVTQSPSTTNGYYELLFSGTADNTERTEGVKKSSDLTYNPYFKLLELPGGSIDTQMFRSEADGYEQGYMTSVRSGNNIHCTLKLGGDNSAVGILRIGNSSGKDAFIKYDSSAASNCDITLPCKDGTLITTSGGATMIGSLSCSTPGADLHWGDITIYGGGSNGNTNAMLIGDDVIIGDCNIGGYMGMKAKSGSTVGFKFMNSSGGNIGELKSNNGALQFVQSGTPRDIWHDGNWSATRAQNCRIIYEYGSGSPRVIGVKYTSGGYMEVSCDTSAYGVNWWQSDTKLKENIKPTEKTALDKVDQIEFIQFDWKNKEEHEDNIHVDLGVSANQIEEFMPDAVWDIEQPEACEFDTLKNIDTGKMSTYALKAIQELHKIVESQAQEIANLKSQLT